MPSMWFRREPTPLTIQMNTAQAAGARLVPAGDRARVTSVSDESEMTEPSIVDILTRTAITASPKFAGSLLVLYEGFRDRRSARVQEACDRIGRGLSSGELRARLAASEELEAVVASAIEAAARTALASKRMLLARVANAAVLDDALVDEAELIVGVLAQIDAPHVRCLEDVFRAEEEARAAGELAPRARGAEREVVQRLVEAGQRHPAPVVTTLRSLGVLDAGGQDDAMLVKGLTEFGRLLVDDLHHASEGATTSEASGPHHEQ